MTQYERNELARKARESGLCMKCGKEIEDREAVTKDGKAFASCISCRPSKKARVNIRDTEYPRVRKVDADDEPHFTETREFKVYALQIANFIRRADESTDENYKGVTLAEIYKAVGRKHVRWTYEALHEIKATELFVLHRYTLRLPIVRSIPLSEAKPFQPSPRTYKVNEKPAGMPARLSI